MRVRRALLYTPGSDLKKIQKAASLDVDCLCMDLEDGVAVTHKEHARQNILLALQNLDFGRTEKLTRLNSAASGLQECDLETVLPGKPNGIVIPKLEHAWQIQSVSQKISAFEDRAGWTAGEICLLVVVETALGLLNLREIAAADPRLQGIIFGAEDYVNDIGATRTTAGSEVLYARSTLVAHAAAYGLQAIDLVTVDFRDTEKLIQEARIGAQLGFHGKQVIHPNQIEPVQTAFTPSEKAIAHARRVVQEFERHQKAGLGAFALDGTMVDAPVVKAAQKVLALAKAAGKLNENG
jgi:citrate lyase beta subunit